MNAPRIFPRTSRFPRTNRRRPRLEVAASAPARGSRCGAAMIETAFVLGIFLTLTFGMLELSITAWDQHIVTQASQQLARIAITHGTLGPPQVTEWSPTTLGGATYSKPASDPGQVATAIKPYLAGLDLTKTTVSLQWLDGNAKTGSRVQAQVVTAHRSILTYVFNNLTWTLTGKATMQIAH